VANDRLRQVRYSSCQTLISRVMVVADRPAASGPKSTGSASAKSPVDSPRRYKTGKTSSSRGERRMYGGRIWLV